MCRLQAQEAWAASMFAKAERHDTERDEARRIHTNP